MKSWMKIAAVILLLAMCGVVGCFGKKGEKVLRADSKDLKHTIVTPHLEAKIVGGKNLIYCCTFQLAWNDLRDNIVKDDIRLENEPPIVKSLNKKMTTKADISPDCYVAMAGFFKDGIIEKINRALRSKFGRRVPAEKEESEADFMAYAFLLKELDFATSFEDLKEPVYFRWGSGTTKLRAFGIREYQPRKRKHAKLATQFSILGVNYGTGECIVRLTSKSPKDEIILAKVKPRKTLLETIRWVQRLTAEKDAGGDAFWEFDQHLPHGDTLQIPKLDFDIGHSYTELIRKRFLNRGFQDNQILVATQDIRLRLNERGAMLRSRAWMENEGGREAVFNEPFLVYLKEKQAKYPYLAIWVAHPEILMKG